MMLLENITHKHDRIQYSWSSEISQTMKIDIKGNKTKYSVITRKYSILDAMNFLRL